MPPSIYPCKVEEYIGNVQNTFSFSGTQIISRLDFGLGQPAAAKSSQERPEAAMT